MSKSDRLQEALNKSLDHASKLAGKLIRAEKERDELAAQVGELREALTELLRWHGKTGDANEDFEDMGEWFYKDTGMLRPGKDQAGYDPNDKERERTFRGWTHKMYLEIRLRVTHALSRPAAEALKRVNRDAKELEFLKQFYEKKVKEWSKKEIIKTHEQLRGFYENQGGSGYPTGPCQCDVCSEAKGGKDAD